MLDLFSGIGGFSLGFERAGMITEAFCEIDPYCQAVLKKHWPHVKLHGDIREIDGKEYEGKIDIVCGGYPCQPFSAAGKRKGEKDKRHLWPEMLRVIRVSKPAWVVAENVRGHVSLGFDTVAAQLEGEGFSVWPFLIPACAIGAPHKRERLWIVANADDSRGGAPGSGSDGNRAAALEGREKQPLGRSGGCGKNKFNSEVGKQWASEPDVGRMADGVPYRMDRIRALGNAIVPQIAEMIGGAIVRFEKELKREPRRR